MATRFLSIFSPADGLRHHSVAVPVAGVNSASRAGRKSLRGTCLPAMTRTPARRTAPAAAAGQVRRCPCAACPTNSDSTQKIMKTFHSSGTPSGSPTGCRGGSTPSRTPRSRWASRRGRRTAPEDQHLDGGAEVRQHDTGPAGAQVVRNVRRTRLRPAAASPGCWTSSSRSRTGSGGFILEVAAPSRSPCRPASAARMMSTRRTGTPPLNDRRPRRGRPGRSPCRAGRPPPAPPGRRRSATSAAGPTSVPSAGIRPVPSENRATISMTTSAP